MFPITYLGSPLGCNLLSLKIWKPLVACVEEKLEGWKSKFISHGARVTLLKLIINSLPIFFITLFILPCGIKDELDRLQYKFLWEGVNLIREYILLVERTYVVIKKMEDWVWWIWKSKIEDYLLNSCGDMGMKKMACGEESWQRRTTMIYMFCYLKLLLLVIVLNYGKKAYLV